MSTGHTEQRRDDVSRYYESAACLNKATGILFWFIAGMSFVLPSSQSLFGSTWHGILQSAFLVTTLVHLSLSLVSRLYLIPKAERIRRRQMLSDAFDTNLVHERTNLYYNNPYLPSIDRLGASTMENALFSKTVAERMLVRQRWIIGCYIVAWLVALIPRHNNLELITWLTQIVFSGDILSGWLKLECLRLRHERTYEQLHTHFLHDIGSSETRALADVLDAFVAYEATKASAGVLLSSKIFDQVNPVLTEEWEQIKTDLKMGSQQENPPDASETAPGAVSEDGDS